MPRVARILIPGVPYHVTQRGNRKQDVFFREEDRQRYLGYLLDYSRRYELDVLAYCLMTTHVHLVSIPQNEISLARTIQLSHMRYSKAVNAQQGWCGHLWQSRFFSTALDEAHLWAAIRYVEQNPVRAGIIERAQDYPWSSAAFHCGLRADPVVASHPIWGEPLPDWERALSELPDPGMLERLRKRTLTGFPCGSEGFVAKMGEVLGRQLINRPPGRPKGK